MHERRLPRARHAGHGDEDAERDVHGHVAEVVQRGVLDPQDARGLPHPLLEPADGGEVPARERAGGPEAVQVALEHHGAAVRSRPGPHVHHPVGDGDDLRLVLDDEHGVALVAQGDEQPVDPLHVVRMQADRGLVEHVGDVGEARAEVAHHLDPLRLAARQRGRLAVEAEVAEADLHQARQRVAQGLERRRDGGRLEAREEAREVVDLHGRALGDVAAVDPALQGGPVQPRAAALRARREGGHPLDGRADVRLRRLDVLGEEGPLEAADEPLPLEVHAADHDLLLRVVQERLPLLGRVVREPLGGVEAAGLRVHAPAPGVHGEVRERDRALVQGLRAVDHRVDVDGGDPAHALARRAHALRVVEREEAGGAHVRLAEPAVDEPQHGVGVRRGADGGPRVRAHPLLVDEDGGAQVAQRVDVGAADVRHQGLQERRVGLVDQPLRLRRDRAEHERGLAGARDAGEDGDRALGDVHGDVAQVVLARAADLDVIQVGHVHPLTGRGAGTHRAPAS